MGGLGSEERPENENKPITSTTRFLSPPFLIYISHFLSSWGDRMWMFAGGLFLVEITPGSLRLVAIYEAAISLTVIFLGAAVGRWVDKTRRLVAAQVSLFVQNVMVCVCTFLLCLLIYNKEAFSTGIGGWAETITEAAVIVVACIAQIGTVGSKIAIEKDWIVVISGENKDELSKMNSVLRTVDLSTEMMAPVLVGFIMSASGMVAGGIAVACWNVVSFMVEYGILHYLFRTIPALQKAKKQRIDVTSRNQKKRSVVTSLKESKETWKRYFKHDIRDAGLSLSVLFMTVLALDNYSRAYVYEGGVSKLVLGLLTACASFTGILGSISYPILRRKMGVLKTGLIGFTSETCCLLLCVGAMFAPGTLFGPYAIPTESLDSNLSSLNKTAISNSTILMIDGASISSVQNQVNDHSSVGLLLTGIILSRFGLWIADLTVTQILQEDVKEEERGGINGVQYSLNQSFSLLRSVFLIILPSVSTFGYMVILSFVFVLAGEMFFVMYAVKHRKSHSKNSERKNNETEVSGVIITETPQIHQTHYDNPEFEDIPL